MKGVKKLFALPSFFAFLSGQRGLFFIIAIKSLHITSFLSAPIYLNINQEVENE